MIYGRNFGGPPIPDTPRSAFRKFKRCIRLVDTRDKTDPPRSHRWTRATLVGIGQSPRERDEMVLVADNGHRAIHVVAKQTAGGEWYGIYVY